MKLVVNRESVFILFIKNQLPFSTGTCTAPLVDWPGNVLDS